MASPPAGVAGVVKDDGVRPVAVLGCGLIFAASIFGISLFDPKTYPLTFLVCTALAGTAYLGTLLLLGGLVEGTNRVLVLCLMIAVIWRVPLLLQPLTISTDTDIYRYVWDGRIQRFGYDPYIVVPRDSEFRPLHTPETLLMNHPNLPTPYPAAAELFFRAVMMIHESARALKSAFFLLDIAIVAILLYWLSVSNRNPWWVLGYAWNPLVAIEGIGNGHVDLLGALCLVVAACSLARRKRAIAALAFALGVGVKFLPVTLTPLFWGRIRLRDAILGLAVIAALYIPFLGHGRLPLGSLGAYLTLWRINAPVYSALEQIFPTAGLVAIPPVLGFAVALWTRWHLAIDAPEAWAWPPAITLLFAPTIYPWYLLWLTPFLLSEEALPLAAWTVSSLFFYWSLPVWAITLVEYGPALSAFGWMLTKTVRARGAP